MGAREPPTDGNGILLKLQRRVWIVDVQKGSSDVQRMNLELLALALADAKLVPDVAIKLCHVITQVPCGLGGEIKVSRVDKRRTRQYEVEAFQAYVQPLVAAARKLQASVLYLPERNDVREDGLVNVALKTRAERFYVSLVKRSHVKLVDELGLRMPGGCLVIGVKASQKLRQVEVPHLELLPAGRDTEGGHPSSPSSWQLEDSSSSANSHSLNSGLEGGSPSVTASRMTPSLSLFRRSSTVGPAPLCGNRAGVPAPLSAEDESVRQVAPKGDSKQDASGWAIIGGVRRMLGVSMKMPDPLSSSPSAPCIHSSSPSPGAASTAEPNSPAALGSPPILAAPFDKPTLKCTEANASMKSQKNNRPCGAENIGIQQQESAAPTWSDVSIKVLINQQLLLSPLEIGLVPELPPPRVEARLDFDFERELIQAHSGRGADGWDFPFERELVAQAEGGAPAPAAPSARGSGVAPPQNYSNGIVRPFDPGTGRDRAMGCEGEGGRPQGAPQIADPWIEDASVAVGPEWCEGAVESNAPKLEVGMANGTPTLSECQQQEPRAALDPAAAEYLAMGLSFEAVHLALAVHCQGADCEDQGRLQTLNVLEFCSAFAQLAEIGFPPEAITGALAYYKNDPVAALGHLAGDLF